MRIFSESDFRLKFSKRLALTLTGTVRGSISFALVASIQTDTKINKDLLLGTMICLVWITNVFFYSFYPFLLSLFKGIDQNSPSTPKNSTLELSEVGAGVLGSSTSSSINFVSVFSNIVLLLFYVVSHVFLSKFNQN